LEKNHDLMGKNHC
jgi:hypothetical protein